MTMYKYADGQLTIQYVPYHMSKMRIISWPAYQRATNYDLDHEQVLKLICDLLTLEEEMRPRAEAKKEAVAMAKDLHGKGWTSERFSNAMHPKGAVAMSTIVRDVEEELSRLDKEGKE